MSSAVLDPDSMALVQATRRLFEDILSQSTGQASTQGSCLYASVLLQGMLHRWSGYEVFIRGGGPAERENCGYHDGTQWQGHYWLELHQEGKPLAVVDITADQFGGPAVQVIPWEFALYRYQAGDQACVDEAVADVRPPG